MLVIRLAPIGKTGERKYRIVVKEKRSKRDGKAVEYLGYYEKKVNETKKDINKERIDYWVQKGAQLSEGVKKLL